MSSEEATFRFNVSSGFMDWLCETRVSVVFSAYQAGRLFLIGVKDDGKFAVCSREFKRPMGLWASSERLYMGTRWQLWQFDNALPAGQLRQGYDRVYVPRWAYTTGGLDVHDIGVDSKGQVVFVNTAYSCLATLSERWSFKPLWRPPFISALEREDRCHLNGLAMADGEPAYVTAVSQTDETGGWRDHRHDGGCVIHVPSGEVVISGLSMPHSPRVHEGKLWILNSGTGEFGTVENGAFLPITFCPGFLRGLSFIGHYALVGVSRPRDDRTFSGLPLDGYLEKADRDPVCGLYVIDIRSGAIVHAVMIEGELNELYDVAILEEVRCPTALGFMFDDVQLTITIETETGPVFQRPDTADLEKPVAELASRHNAAGRSPG